MATTDRRAVGSSRPARAGPGAGSAVALPPGAHEISLLGVDYTHVKTPDGGDLYLTAFGRSLWQHLLPANWYAREWFEAKRERLVGTSTVYRLPTRAVDGRQLQLVVKWSRVGEAVPLDTLTINRFINAEFNSPFEEFALVLELRAGRTGPGGIRVRTQKPLAIYVPSARLKLWQTGRSESKIAAKLAQHPGVEIDILRQYVLLYGWIKGRDAVETADHFGWRDPEREQFFSMTTSLVAHELEQKGYRMIDMKPAHAIVRPRPDGTLLRDRHGQIAYALIDYELLERTPEHERAVRSTHRLYYLRHMARRFDQPTAQPLPAHLRPARLLGVDYIFGHAESTGGALWVVGNDPDLFTYFLPERWRRTPKEALSANNQIFYTRTKDDIHLVWRVSRVGDDPVPGGPADHADHGINSPFEEFAMAIGLAVAGVPTTYPRAIYMTGPLGAGRGEVADRRRYEASGALRTPDGEPALSPDRDYIAIWGFWNGPDELLAAAAGRFVVHTVDTREAVRRGLIGEACAQAVVERFRERLARHGYEDLNLKADHLLLSVDDQQQILLDTGGAPAARLCNFEFVRRVK